MNSVFRVLHIAPGAPFGGVQRVVLDLTQAQAPRYNVSLLWTGEEQRSEWRPSDGQVLVLYAQGTLGARIKAARKLVRELDPDIIHLHMAPPWIAFALLGARAKVCLHLHGMPSRAKGLKGWVGSAIERWTIARADVLVAISDWIEAAWRKLYPTPRYRKVFNGTPLGVGSGVSRVTSETQPAVIGFASRLAADKGVGEFARFVLEMHKRLPAARFRIAGEGPERKLLEQELSPLIAIDQVELLGHVTDMTGFWSQLDLAIFTAPAEPFGLRLIEPVAEGVPVIAYETGAGSDEISSKCAAIATVPYENAQAMAELALKLLTDPDRRKTMALKGKKDVARKFSIAAMSAGIEKVYLELIEDRDCFIQ